MSLLKKYWVAQTSSSMDSSANWSLSSGGTGGETSVPGITDEAIFDQSGQGSCRVDSGITPGGIDQSSGFTSTLKVFGNNSDFHIMGNFIIADGTFNSNRHNIFVETAPSIPHFELEYGYDGPRTVSGGLSGYIEKFADNLLNFGPTDKFYVEMDCVFNSLSVNYIMSYYQTGSGGFGIGAAGSYGDNRSFFIYLPDGSELNFPNSKWVDGVEIKIKLEYNAGVWRFYLDGVERTETVIPITLMGIGAMNRMTFGESSSPFTISNIVIKKWVDKFLMSYTYIAGNLILQGNLTCDGEARVDSTGLVVPVPSEISDYIFSCPTKHFMYGNGKAPVIISTQSNIIIDGLIDGIGKGFPANAGPGANSLLLDNQEDPASIFGANHAGIGTVWSTPGGLAYVEEQITINASHEEEQAFPLIWEPIGDNVAVNVIGGTSLELNVDFYIIDGKVNYRTVPLESLVEIGDQFRVLYLADTERMFPPPKTTYGDYEAPTSIGSGSGETGGGSGITLVAENGTISLNGLINMNGADGITSNSGGGAGGSIWAVGYNIDGTGILSADGGGADYTYAGGGGGGYISLQYENNFSFTGSSSVNGGKGATDGIVYVQKIEPILSEKFTGRVLNPKWWEIVQGSASINNQIDMTTAQLQSLFEISGENIKTDIGFIPVGTDDTSYFRLYADSSNWAGVTRAGGIIFGAYSVDGTITSQTGTSYALISTKLRILKSDSTFTFQFVDSSAGPQTLSFESIPDLDSSRFTVLIGTDGTCSWDSFRVFRGILDNLETTEPRVYVDSIYGSDSSSGRALSPLKNLFVATAWAKRGGTVVLYDGTYNPSEIIKKNLTILGANGASPVITTAYVRDTTGSNWEASCLTFRNCQGLVKNIRLKGASSAILAENTHDLEISDCEIFDSTTGINFTTYTQSPRILRNTIHDVTTGISFVSEFPNTRAQAFNAVFNSNVLYNDSTGISLVDSSNFLVSSNTIDGAHLGINVASDSQGFIVSNNITNDTTGILIDSDSSVVAALNNDFYGTDSSIINFGYLVDTSSLPENPQYVNRAAKNFHLQSNSSVIGRGSEVLDNYLLDRDSIPRQDHSDVGAYRYISTTHAAGNYYVDSSGSDYLNTGNANSPYRTLDKAMSAGDASVFINTGHFDSYYLNLKNQTISFIDGSSDSSRLLQSGHTIRTFSLESHYSNINLGDLRFVSPNGNDISGTGTIALPFRTITKALQDASIATNIVVIPAEYQVFDGSNCTLFSLTDFTGVETGQYYVEDAFETALYPGHSCSDSSLWTLTASGDSTAFIQDGYLSLTYDETNSTQADSVFALFMDGSALTCSAELRQAFNPLCFNVTNGNNTVTVKYLGGDCTSVLCTGDITNTCYSHLTSLDSEEFFTDYACLSSQDIQAKQVALTYMILDPFNVAVNIVGGTSQELDTDFRVYGNIINWNGLGLDGTAIAGDILRVIYKPLALAPTVKINIQIENDILTVTGKRNQKEILNYGETWVSRPASDSSHHAWRDVAMSGDGKFQTAVAADGYIYTSCNYGANWYQTDSTQNWVFVAMSADGRIQTAAYKYNYIYEPSGSGKIYVSTNYGATWTLKFADLDWRDVAMSGDGKFQTAVAYGDITPFGNTGGIFVSMDYGNSWTQTSSSESWACISMSSDGRIQIAGKSGSFVFGSYVYLSTDYGSTWNSVSTPYGNCYALSMSSDGRIITGVFNGDYIYTSTDYGVTWTPRDSIRDWADVAMSADGFIQAAVTLNGHVYVSVDFGETWTVKPGAGNYDWRAITMSENGRRMTAVNNDGFIYTSDIISETKKTVMKRNLYADSTSNPWTVHFYMDDISGLDLNTFGRGYVSKFFASAKTIEGTDKSKPFENKIWRKPLLIFNDRRPMDERGNPLIG